MTSMSNAKFEDSAVWFWGYADNRHTKRPTVQMQFSDLLDQSVNPGKSLFQKSDLKTTFFLLYTVKWK